MSKTTIINNSGIDNLDFSNQSLVGKYIETNLGNKGIVVREYLCYPEPSEWVLDSGYVEKSKDGKRYRWKDSLE